MLTPLGQNRNVSSETELVILKLYIVRPVEMIQYKFSDNWRNWLRVGYDLLRKLLELGLLMESPEKIFLILKRPRPKKKKKITCF